MRPPHGAHGSSSAPTSLTRTSGRGARVTRGKSGSGKGPCLVSANKPSGQISNGTNCSLGSHLPRAQHGRHTGSRPREGPAPGRGPTLGIQQEGTRHPGKLILGRQGCDTSFLTVCHVSRDGEAHTHKGSEQSLKLEMNEV